MPSDRTLRAPVSLALKRPILCLNYLKFVVPVAVLHTARKERHEFAFVKMGYYFVFSSLP